MRRTNDDEARRGSALVLALLAITAIAALSAAFLRVTTSLTSRRVSETDNLRAFYVAEAGLAEALQSLRIGRKGVIGGPGAPAVFGDGVVWVEAQPVAELGVQLTSNAVCGRGRSSLGVVVEPLEEALGFFALEDLRLGSVVLVDGYDSGAGTYESQAVPPPASATRPLDEGDVLLRVCPWDDPCPVEGWISDRQATGDGTLRTPDGYFIPVGSRLVYEDGRDYRVLWDEYWARYGRFPKAVNRWVEMLVPSEPAPAGGDATGGGALGLHTGGGGLLGSNGDIVFDAAGSDPSEVWGDLVPGPGKQVLGDVTVHGDEAPRLTAVELPPIEIPLVDTSRGSLRHEDPIPLVVPPGEVRFGVLEIAPSGELVIQGPATVVVERLVLEAGSALSLDTSAGAVELYVTGSLDLEPGSTIETPGVDPGSLAVRVGNAGGPAGEPEVQLEATGQFHGLVYAPTAHVRVGADFEAFGGIVSRLLEVADGARLHFDNGDFSANPFPRILSWRIVEIPVMLRNTSRLASTDGLLPLAEASDLAGVNLDIRYLDLSGTDRNFSGPEENFDRGDVSQVISEERTLDADAYGQTQSSWSWQDIWDWWTSQWGLQ